jgi:hypothetical protein
MNLREWLPQEFFNKHSYSELYRHMDAHVSESYVLPALNGPVEKKHPFKHKHIFSWCILDDGLAVGVNERPGSSRGMSFPYKRMKS